MRDAHLKQKRDIHIYLFIYINCKFHSLQIKLNGNVNSTTTDSHFCLYSQKNNE